MGSSGDSTVIGEAGPTPQKWLQGLKSKVAVAKPEYEFLGFHDTLLLQDIVVLLFEPGHLTFTIPVTARLTNKYNTLHGGAIASLVDMSGAFAMTSAIGRGIKGVTTDITISYISAAPLNAQVEVEAKVMKLEKVVVVVVDIRDTVSKKHFAQGRVSMFISSPISKL